MSLGIFVTQRVVTIYRQSKYQHMSKLPTYVQNQNNFQYQEFQSWIKYFLLEESIQEEMIA